ncbi:hypothetical protein RYX36_007619 [Vicia faba]
MILFSSITPSFLPSPQFFSLYKTLSFSLLQNLLSLYCKTHLRFVFRFPISLSFLPFSSIYFFTCFRTLFKTLEFIVALIRVLGVFIVTQIVNEFSLTALKLRNWDFFLLNC